jgi:hypothetical protein
MIAIVAVRPNVLRGPQYLFCPQKEPSIFIFGQKIMCCGEKHLFFIELKSVFTEVLAKGKIGPVFL